MIGDRRHEKKKKGIKKKSVHLDCDSPRLLKRLYVKSPELFKDTEEPTRPKTRGECATVPRPCPFVSCRYNLFLDIKPESGGGITYTIGRSKEPSDMPESASCALDVAAAHAGVGMTLDHVGEFFSIDRERIRQIERIALEKIKRKLERRPRGATLNNTNGNKKKT